MENHGITRMTETQNEHLRGTHFFVARADEMSGSSEEDIKWKVITALVEDYSKIHPQEIREIIEENKKTNSTFLSAFNRTELRAAFRCPPGLIRVIERRFPNLFTDKDNVHQFMRRFPGFSLYDL